MSSTGQEGLQGENLARLETAGLILDSAGLSEDHRAVIEALTSDEVDILESIKHRLDTADKAQGLTPSQPGKPPRWATNVIF